MEGFRETKFCACFGFWMLVSGRPRAEGRSAGGWGGRRLSDMGERTGGRCIINHVESEPSDRDWSSNLL